MLGAPAEDIDRFKSWSNDITLIVEPMVTPAKVEGGQTCHRGVVRLLRDIVEAR